MCVAGKVCNTTGMTEPYDCPAGFYCPLVDDTRVGDLNKVLLKCPAGTYSPFIGLQSES